MKERVGRLSDLAAPGCMHTLEPMQTRDQVRHTRQGAGANTVGKQGGRRARREQREGEQATSVHPFGAGERAKARCCSPHDEPAAAHRTGRAAAPSPSCGGGLRVGAERGDPVDDPCSSVVPGGIQLTNRASWGAEPDKTVTLPDFSEALTGRTPTGRAEGTL